MVLPALIKPWGITCAGLLNSHHSTFCLKSEKSTVRREHRAQAFVHQRRHYFAGNQFLNDQKV